MIKYHKNYPLYGILHKNTVILHNVNHTLILQLQPDIEANMANNEHTDTVLHVHVYDVQMSCICVCIQCSTFIIISLLFSYT